MPSRRHRSTRSFATGAAATLAALVGLALAGCASVPGDAPSPSPPATAPYVGIFTGRFVDGKPLYRFPTIEVTGSRSVAGAGD
jgi:hypothetical protein